MPNINIREYNPQDGSLIGNISSLNYGKITAGLHSRVKVIDIAFSGIDSVGNIKLGLVSSGGITVYSHFGITDSIEFDSTKASQTISNHFIGINGDNTSGNINNYNIGNRTLTISNYIYLDIELSASNIGQGSGAYKIYFDYS